VGELIAATCLTYARAACLAIAALAVSACATVGSSGSAVTKTFVGVVQVRTPSTAGDLHVAEVSGLGVGWDAGPWVGWRSGSWVTADPAKCQLLVIIRSPVQAANAAQVLQALKGSEPCMVDSTQH
jgi:hypothetical protein